MRKMCGLILGLVGLAFISGCGCDGGGGLFGGGGEEFVSNAAAVEALGGTTWGDPGSGASLQFDENAKIIGFDIPDLPEEFANIRIDGEPFTVTIPNDPAIPSIIAGQSFTLSLENTVTTINDDGSVTLEFKGDASVPLVNGITMSLTAKVDQVDGKTVLNDLVGSLSASTLIGEFPIVENQDFGGGIPLEKLL